MSVEKKRSPVLDEDGEDTEKIVEDKDYSKESTGAKSEYQHVVDQQGNRTGKVITPDGRVLTEQPIPEPRLPTFPPMEGGLSVHFPDINIHDVVTEPLFNVTGPLLDVDVPPEAIKIDIPESLVDIDITRPLVDVDLPEKVIDINITEPLVEIPEKVIDITITEPLVDVDIPEKIIDIAITEPLIDMPEEWPEIPDEIVKIVGPLIEMPEIPEDIVNIVGPMVEIPEWPEEGLVQIGDISMPDVVGGIDVDLPEIPEGVQYGAIGVGVLIGLGILLLGIGRTASAVKGIAKAVK